MTEFIIDVRETDESDEAIRDKTTRVLAREGYTVEISKVTKNVGKHSATVIYEYKPIPGYVMYER
ncbi:hypothetical protein [Pseudomonas sp. Leaf59]|uniref:hypothetical protein n=1 Tax=Pseudomonas sp. Leaf59 TaxID=2876556 RepID=UPI001E582174|nr:hypothetical protein [Pseudomonas sp. Leaf59]